MRKIFGVVFGVMLLSSLGTTVSADTVFPTKLVIEGSLVSTPADLDFRTIGTFGEVAQDWHIIADFDQFVISEMRRGTSNSPFIIERGAHSQSLAILQDGTVFLGLLGFEGPTLPGKLHIFGDATQDVFNGIGPDPNSFDTGTALNFGYSGSSFGLGSGFVNVRPAPGAVAPNPSLRFATANVQRMIIDNLGNVGIGSFGAAIGNPGTSPLDKLHVQGNVRADGNFIANGTTLAVPDYVFEPGYKLMPLPQLARYVEHEKHLPDIPTAQAIKSQGVNMSEMQMLLLKKVEELTLYTVEQEKLIQRLTKRVLALEHPRMGRKK